MAEGPINPDREQQRADNVASRRQSGLEPLPKDREEPRREGRDGEGTDREGTAGEGGEGGERGEAESGRGS